MDMDPSKGKKKWKKTTYIYLLSEDVQMKIYEKLQKVHLLENEDIENAMNSRVCDLEELISFKEIQQLEKGEE